VAKNDCIFKLLCSSQIFVISPALEENSDTISHVAIDGFLKTGVWFLSQSSS
jgi:hypothetical protein